MFFEDGFFLGIDPVIVNNKQVDPFLKTNLHKTLKLIFCSVALAQFDNPCEIQSEEPESSIAEDLEQTLTIFENDTELDKSVIDG